MISTPTDNATHTRVTLGELMAPLAAHMEALQDFLADQVDHFETEVQPLVRYCLRNQGKRLRPMLVFFSGWKDAGVQPDLVKAGAVVELVHLATLVHDDILDDASIRHNSDTVSERWGASAAVLLGDAIFAHALSLAASFPTVDICRVVARSTRRICGGEIAQTFQRGNALLSFSEYYRVIDLKTAELFYVSCLLGANLSGQSAAKQEKVGLFGRHLGIAYQIYDDLADLFGEEETIGKTLGTDLASGKFTLPTLLFLQSCPEVERDATLRALQDGTFPAERLRQEAIENGVLAEVARCIENELEAADNALDGDAERDAHQHLRNIARFLRQQTERYL